MKNKGAVLDGPIVVVLYRLYKSPLKEGLYISKYREKKYPNIKGKRTVCGIMHFSAQKIKFLKIFKNNAEDSCNQIEN